ncbi:MAG TPA: helix-turn-helix domain-containing protein [Conexibacter sp.]|nr:helix-turn-helix domain-containing protein [Conexibacter sp.]
MTEHRTPWPLPATSGRSRADLAWSRALAHPVRVEILRALLEQEPGTPSGFAATLEIPLGVASHHVRRLRELRLIRIVRRTHIRGAVQHHYRLCDRGATSQALWRWGIAPQETEQADLLDGAELVDAGRETMQRVVAVLRTRRERQGMSRVVLAHRAGVSPDQLGRIERGEADPRMSVLLTLAAVLALPLRELFAEAEATSESEAAA